MREPEPELVREANELAERAPAPAVHGNVLTGTAGWTDRTLIASKLFYPRGVSSGPERLEYYARHFRLVEVDATYYSILPRESAERWLRITPPEFYFDVKAHPVITGHPIDPERLPRDLADHVRRASPDKRHVYADRLPEELVLELEARFDDFLRPLREAERLGCLMVQFPPWFTATRRNAMTLDRIAERWGHGRVAIEFRNRSWLSPERRDRVFAKLRELGLAYVCVDEPDASRGGVASVAEVTRPDLGVVRLHGRNLEGWEKRGASVHERFDYLYSREELRSWVAPVRRLANDAERVHVILNNCVRNYAVLNAKGFSALLGDAATGDRVCDQPT